MQFKVFYDFTEVQGSDFGLGSWTVSSGWCQFVNGCIMKSTRLEMDPSSCSFPIAQPQKLFRGALPYPSRPHFSVPVSPVHPSVCFPRSLSMRLPTLSHVILPPTLGFSTCSAVYLTAMQPAAMNSCWLGRSAAFSY